MTPEMLAIPAGGVTLSDRRTSTSWWVDVPAFEIAPCPVTRGEYAAVTGEWPGEVRGERLPADSVSWWNAIRFCNALSERDGDPAAYRIAGNDVEWDRAAGGYRLPRLRAPPQPPDVPGRRRRLPRGAGSA